VAAFAPGVDTGTAHRLRELEVRRELIEPYRARAVPETIAGLCARLDAPAEPAAARLRPGAGVIIAGPVPGDPRRPGVTLDARQSRPRSSVPLRPE